MLHNMHVVSVCFKCFIRMLQVFYLYVVKVHLDIACVCDGFQVFSGVLQLFQTYVGSISIVSDICYKSRSGVAHVAMGSPVAAACGSCWGAAERAQNVPRLHVRGKRTRHERSLCVVGRVG
jgi:hypothetical protein